MKVTVHDVKGDGSCFFRSIYYSARYTGNLEYILKHVVGVRHPVLNAWTEELFVTEMRKAFANKLLHGPYLNDVHAYLRDVYVNSRETYDEIILAYPSWFTEQFKRIPRNVDTFKRRFSRHVLKKTNWVSQIEVDFFKSILAHQPRIQSHSSSSSSAHQQPPQFVIFNNLPSNKKALNCTTMYILNVEEAHYNYVLCRSCAPPRAKVINPITKRCVKTSGRTGKKLIKKAIPVYK
jgi:hypothetical protein